MTEITPDNVKDIIRLLQAGEDAGHFRMMRTVEFNKNEVYFKVHGKFSNYDLALLVMHYVMGGTNKFSAKTPANKKMKLTPLLTTLTGLGVTLSQLACAFAPMAVIFAKTLADEALMRSYQKEQAKNDDFNARHIELIKAGLAWSGAACVIDGDQDTATNAMYMKYMSWLEEVTRIINGKKTGDEVNQRVLQSGAIAKKQFMNVGASGWTVKERKIIMTDSKPIIFKSVAKDTKTMKEVLDGEKK